MSKKIAFIGGDSQVGTTMAAQAMAEELSKRQAKVLLVLASGKAGDDYIINKENKSIDDIKANLINGHLERYELSQVLVKEKGLWVLPGVRDYLSASYYTENVMDTLVSAADFDFIILDCGDDFRLGLVVSAVGVADRRYIVITQQEKTLRRFSYMKESVLDPLGIEGELIICKYQHNISLLYRREIERKLSIKVAGQIPYIEYGWQAEIEYRTLMDLNKYNRAICNIANEITGEYKENKSWIKNLISKNI